jgi:hypothetical protein
VAHTKLGVTMSNWQPIETAPKDGTDILIWNGSWMVTVRWAPPYQYGYWDLVECGTHASDGFLTYDPTHWMPLPSKPQKEESNE